MNRVPGSAHVNYTVGALVAAGGLMGYIQRKSVPSLVAGVSIGSADSAAASPQLQHNACLLSWRLSHLLSLSLCCCVSALYGVSAYLISTGDHVNGHLLATVTSSALALTMANRWRRTGQPMPAALLTGIGAGAGLYNGIKWNEWRK